MSFSTMLVLVLLQGTLAEPTRPTYERGLETLIFLEGTWIADFERRAGVLRGSDGPGTVQGAFGPDRKWFEIETRVTVREASPYSMKVLIYRGNDGRLEAHIVSLEGGTSYTGGFRDDATLELRGVFGGRTRRATYQREKSGRIRFVLEESADSGHTFERLEQAVWQRPSPSESAAGWAQHQIQDRLTSGIAHLEIPASDPEGMSQFYTAVFGWRFDKQEGPGWQYWATQTSSGDRRGATLGLVRPERDDHRPLPVVYVTSIADVERVIVEQGGSVAVARHAITGVGWQASYLDPERNVFALFQFDSNAR